MAVLVDDPAKKDVKKLTKDFWSARKPTLSGAPDTLTTLNEVPETGVLGKSYSPDLDKEPTEFETRNIWNLRNLGKGLKQGGLLSKSGIFNTFADALTTALTIGEQYQQGEQLSAMTMMPKKMRERYEKENFSQGLTSYEEAYDRALNTEIVEKAKAKAIEARGKAEEVGAEGPWGFLGRMLPLVGSSLAAIAVAPLTKGTSLSFLPAAISSAGMGYVTLDMAGNAMYDHEQYCKAQDSYYKQHPEEDDRSDLMRMLQDPKNDAAKWGIFFLDAAIMKYSGDILGTSTKGIGKLAIMTGAPKVLGEAAANILKDNPQLASNLFTKWAQQSPVGKKFLIQVAWRQTKDILKSGGTFSTMTALQDFMENMYKDPEDRLKFQTIVTNALQQYVGGAAFGLMMSPARLMGNEMYHRQRRKESGINLVMTKDGVYERLGRDEKDPNLIHVLDADMKRKTIKADEIEDMISMTKEESDAYLDAYARGAETLPEIEKAIRTNAAKRTIIELTKKIASVRKKKGEEVELNEVQSENKLEAYEPVAVTLLQDKDDNIFFERATKQMQNGNYYSVLASVEFNPDGTFGVRYSPGKVFNEGLKPTGGWQVLDQMTADEFVNMQVGNYERLKGWMQGKEAPGTLKAPIQAVDAEGKPVKYPPEVNPGNEIEYKGRKFIVSDIDPNTGEVIVEPKLPDGQLGATERIPVEEIQNIGKKPEEPTLETVTKEIKKEQGPLYSKDGSEVSKAYVKRAILTATDPTQLATLKWRDEELDKIFAKQFPQTVTSYKIGKETVERDEIEAAIDFATKPEQLKDIKITKDAELEIKLAGKLAQLSGKPLLTPESKQATETKPPAQVPGELTPDQAKRIQEYEGEPPAETDLMQRAEGPPEIKERQFPHFAEGTRLTGPDQPEGRRLWYGGLTEEGKKVMVMYSDSPGSSYEGANSILYFDPQDFEGKFTPHEKQSKQWKEAQAQAGNLPVEGGKKTEEEIKLEIKAESDKVEPRPTDGQKEAGNYPKGHVSTLGMEISIETARDGIRSGTDRNGKEWIIRMNNNYGEILGTEGADGDRLDIFLGEDFKDGMPVFIIDQVDPETGKFDEHKVMLGFNTQDEAIAAYRSNYEPHWRGMGGITEMTLDKFKEWAYNKPRTKEPINPDVLEYQQVVKAREKEKPPVEKPTVAEKKQEILDNAEKNKDYEILALQKDNSALGKERLGAVLKKRAGEKLTIRQAILAERPGMTKEEVIKAESLLMADIVKKIEVYKDNPGVPLAKLPSTYAARIISELDSRGIEHQGEKTKLTDVLEKLKPAKPVTPVVEEKPEAKSKKKKEVTITLKPRKKGLSFKPDSRTGKAANHVPQDFTEAVLQYFATGGRAWAVDFARNTGFAKVIKENGVEKIQYPVGTEFKKYFSLLSNTGARLADFHEKIANSFGMEEKGAMDMTNEIIDLMKTFNSRGKMLTELERRMNAPNQQEQAPEEFIDDIDRDINPGDIDRLAPEIMNENYRIFLADEEIMSIFTMGEFTDDRGIIDWDALRVKVNLDPGYFTQYPFGLTKESFELFKSSINDKGLQRIVQEQIQPDRPDEGESKGDLIQGGIPGYDQGIEGEGEKEPQPAGEQQVLNDFREKIGIDDYSDLIRNYTPGEGEEPVVSPTEFFSWLTSSDPLDPNKFVQDKRWTDLVTKARKILDPNYAPPVPQAEMDKYQGKSFELEGEFLGWADITRIGGVNAVSFKDRNGDVVGTITWDGFLRDIADGKIKVMEGPVISKEITDRYYEIKKKHPDSVLLLRNGDNYLILDTDDIQAVSNILSIPGEPVLSIPANFLDTALPMLTKAGLKVAVAEELKAPPEKMPAKPQVQWKPWYPTIKEMPEELMNNVALNQIIQTLKENIEAARKKQALFKEFGGDLFGGETRKYEEEINIELDPAGESRLDDAMRAILVKDMEGKNPGEVQIMQRYSLKTKGKGKKKTVIKALTPTKKTIFRVGNPDHYISREKEITETAKDVIYANMLRDSIQKVGIEEIDQLIAEKLMPRVEKGDQEAVKMLEIINFVKAEYLNLPQEDKNERDQQAGPYDQGLRNRPEQGLGPANRGDSGGRNARPGLVYATRENIPAHKEYITPERYDIDEDQLFAVNHILDAFFEKDKKAFLLADGTGVGKTRQILAVANEYLKRTNKPVLIITENKQIIENNFAEDARALGIDTDKFELATYSALRTGNAGKSGPYGLVIFDEAHNLKNQESAQTLAAQALQADHRMYSTATPMDTPVGSVYFISQVTNLPVERVYSMLGFTVKKQKIIVNGQEIVEKLVIMIAKGNEPRMIKANIIRIRDEMIAGGTMLRREYPFFGSIKEADIQLTPEQQADGNAIQDYWDEQEEQAMNDNGVVPPKLLMSLRGQRSGELSRWNEANKIEVAFNKAIEQLQNGKKVIIIAEGIKPTFIKGLNREVPGTLESLEKLFADQGIRIARIYGDNDKALANREFQDGDADVIIGTPKSAAAGINLDNSKGDKDRFLISMTPNYSGNVFDQLLGRVSRRNTLTPSIVELLFNNSASDVRRREIVKHKLGTLKAITEGRIIDDIDLEGIEYEAGQPGVLKPGPQVEMKGYKPGDKIYYVRITDKAFVVKGDTHPIKEFIKSLGGKWNKKYGGWIFPLRYLDEIKKSINEHLNPPAEQAPPPEPEPPKPPEPEVPVRVETEETVSNDEDTIKNEQAELDLKDEETPQTKEELEQEKIEFTEAEERARKVSGITDFGEKIGGARKDLADKFIRNGQIKKENVPAWLKGWHLGQEKDGKFYPFLAKGSFITYRSKQGFDSEEQALMFIQYVWLNARYKISPYTEGPMGQRIQKWMVYRKLSDRKRVKLQDGLESEQHAHLWMMNNKEMLFNYKPSFPVRPHLEVVKRSGSPYRTSNVTPEQFRDAFGFMGGEFGNWVPQDERQRILNMAYDGLMDMAKVLGIPPKALSLGGQLSIAFGARGHGLKGAAAHYETARGVFNLTRINGAGSVAHEWLHALDHYLGRVSQGMFVSDRKAGEKYENVGDMLSAIEKYRQKTLRPEVKDAFDQLLTSLFKLPKIVEVSVERYEKMVEKGKESIAYELQEMRNWMARGRSWGRKKLPATPEQLNKFDVLMLKVLGGQYGKEIYVDTKQKAWRSNEFLKKQSYEILVELDKAYKDVMGISAMTKGGRLESLYHQIGRLEASKKQLEKYRIENKEEQLTPTQYYYNARDIDGRRVSSYWATEAEMLARAYEAFIEDEIASKGNLSQYLVHGTDNKWYLPDKPYPEGDERQIFSNAFRQFFKTILAVEQEDGNIDLREPRVSYESLDGDVVGISSLLGEPGPGQLDLFADSEKQDSDDGDVVTKAKQGERLIQRALKPGEMSVLELRYSINKGMTFNGAEKIRDAGDVAFLFKALETASIEHAFVVGIVKGKPVVLHLSMGGYAGTIINVPTIVDFVNRFNPTELYFLHNHPSGNMNPSEGDTKIARKVNDALRDRIKMICMIIDIIKGQYCIFTPKVALTDAIYPEGGIDVRYRPETGPPDMVSHKVYQFDRRVFSKDINIDEYYKSQILNSAGVAKLISAQKFTQGKKLAALFLDRANHVVANIHLPYSDMNKDAEKIADYLEQHATRFGAMGTIIYGNIYGNMAAKSLQNFNSVNEGVAYIKNRIMNMELNLMDVLHMDHIPNITPGVDTGNEYQSMAENGMLEPPSPSYYGISKVEDSGSPLTPQQRDMAERIEVLKTKLAKVLHDKELKRRELYNRINLFTSQGEEIQTKQEVFAGQSLFSGEEEKKAKGLDTSQEKINEILGAFDNEAARYKDELGKLTKALDRSFKEGGQGKLFEAPVGYDLMEDNKGNYIAVKPLPVGMEVVDGFYSNLEKTIREHGKESMRPKDWLNVIGKKEEAELTGLRKTLEQLDRDDPKAMISKYGLAELVARNRIKVVENYLGVDDPRIIKLIREKAAIATKIGSATLTKEGETAREAFRKASDEFEKNFSSVSEKEQDRLRDNMNETERVMLRAYSAQFQEEYRQMMDIQAEIDMRNQNKLETKYEKSTLPGPKKRYREILLTSETPKERPYISPHFDLPNIVAHLRADVRSMRLPVEGFASELEIVRKKNREGEEIWAVRYKGEEGNTIYMTPDFDEAVKYRDEIRRMADKRIYFIEEIQSDWAEKGRKEGFRLSGISAELTAMDAKINEVRAGKEFVEADLRVTIGRMQELGLPPGASSGEVENFEYGYRTNPEYVRLEKEQKEVRNNRDWDAIVKRMNEIEEEYRFLGYNRKELIRKRGAHEILINDLVERRRNIANEGVPIGPYIRDTNAWTKLALKVALKDAIREGADYIAWTSGEMQNARYDLRKHIQRLVISKQTDDAGATWYVVDGLNGANETIITKDGINNEKELEQVIGYEMTQKAMEKFKAIIPTSYDDKARDRFLDFKDRMLEKYKKELPPIETEGWERTRVLNLFIERFLITNSKASLDEAREYQRLQSEAIIASMHEWPRIEFQGDDLKLGGEGMLAYYGSTETGKLGIVGNLAKAALGQTPSTIRIDASEGKYVNPEDIEEDMFGNALPPAEGTGKFEISNEETFAIEITPEMREMAERGMPQYDLAEEVRRRDMFAGEFFKQDVYSEIKRLADRFSKELGVPITVVEKVENLPKELKDDMKEDAILLGKKFTPKAVLLSNPDKGESQVYIVSSTFNDPNKAINSIFHEIVSHYGLPKMLGWDRYIVILEKVYEGMSEVDRENIRSLYGSDKRKIAHEYFGRMAKNENLHPSLWQRIVEFVKRLINRVFNRGLTDLEVKKLLRDSFKWVKRQAKEKPDFAGDMVAWHGSKTQDIVRFDLKRNIKTGVGENYRGYGLYQTKSEGLAKYLAIQSKNISDYLENAHRTLGEKGKRVLEKAMFRNKHDYERSIRDLEGKANKYAQDPVIKNRFIRAAEFLYNNPIPVTSALYKTIMGRGKELEQLNLMDWDKPVSAENMDLVLSQLAREADNPNQRDLYNYLSMLSDIGLIEPSEMTGGDLYKKVAEGLESDRQASLFFSRAGIDGNTYKEPFSERYKGAENFVIFDDSNVKIIGEISYEVAEEEPKYIGPPANILQTKREKSVELWQNRMLSVREWQNKITGRGGKLDEMSNPYRQENLSHGAVKAQTEIYDKEYVVPLIEKVAEIIKGSGLTYSEFNDYLKAKHIPERNEWFIAMHPKASGKVYGGLTTEEAMNKVIRYESRMDPNSINELWQLINKATEANLTRDFNNGFISEEIYNEVKGRWRYYVPLRGFKPLPQDAMYEYQREDIGKEFNPFRKAFGRTSEADDPLQYIVNMGHTSIMYGEKNRIKQHASRLIRNNPEMDDLHRFKKVWFVWDGTTDPETGEKNYVEITEKPDKALFDEGFVRQKSDTRHFARRPSYQAKEHEVEVYIGGDKYVMVLPADVADAINRTPSRWDQVAYVLQDYTGIGSFTRWLSTNFTAKNPAFIPINQMRDLQYAVLSHLIQGDSKRAGVFIKSLKMSRAAIIRNLAGKQGVTAEDKKLDSMYLDFKIMGGETGWIHMEDVDKIRKNIQRDIARLNKTNTTSDKILHAQIMRNLGEWMDHMAIRSENLSRFATYVTMIEFGYTKAEAAYAAKNITVNFNRKGRISGLMGSLYSFFNVGIQGGENILGLAKHHWKKFFAWGAGMMAMGFLDALFSSLWSEDDEFGENIYQKLNPYLRHNMFCITIGDHIITMPLPHGFRWFHSLGVAAYELAFMDGPTLGMEAHRILSDLFNSLTPVNPAEFLNQQGSGFTVRPLILTTFVPIYDISVNQDFSGASVYKEPFTKRLEDEVSDAGSYRNNVNPAFKSVTDFFYQAGGGDKNVDAEYWVNSNDELEKVTEWLDVNPSKAEHLFNYWLGGRGQFWNDIIKTTGNIVRGSKEAIKDKDLNSMIKEINMNDIPIARRLIRQPWMSTARLKYQDIADELEHYLNAKSSVKRAYKGTPEEEMPVSGKWQEKINLYRTLQAELRYIKKDLADAEGDSEMVKELKDTQERLIRNFVNEYSKIEER